MNLTQTKSDNIGVVASSICLIHCIITPFIFIAKSCNVTCCNDSPIWWNLIDYLFLFISFTAVYSSTKSTTKQWVKSALWLNWLLLFGIIVNEKMEWYHLEEYFIYFPAIALILLHLYNKKYCNCAPVDSNNH